ncbi:MAG: TetR/AcrR family transcriptional regulator [Lachnospiraceae bacterium]|nr:TetR/AcrR family transcriptional regulator [Lachnospiraceae bacterium]
MGKTEENKKMKREALLSSAFELFTEKGMQKTTISDIVKRATLAKGTFYLYFKDKYDIRDKLIAMKGGRIIEDACNALLELIKKEHPNLSKESDDYNFEEGIIFLADYVIDHFESNKALLRFMSKNLSVALFSGGNTEEEKNRCIEAFDKIIKVCDLEFRDETLMFYMVIELVNSTCYDCIIRNSPVSMDEMRPELYRAISNIVRQFECSVSNPPLQML